MPPSSAAAPGSDSYHPFCYRGLAVIAEAGETVSVQAEFGQSATLCYDIDLDIVRRGRTTPAGFAPAAFRFPAVPHDYALRSFSSTPYLPMEPEAERRTLREWFELQSHSLATASPTPASTGRWWASPADWTPPWPCWSAIGPPSSCAFRRSISWR